MELLAPIQGILRSGSKNYRYGIESSRLTPSTSSGPNLPISLIRQSDSDILADTNYLESGYEGMLTGLQSEM